MENVQKLIKELAEKENITEELKSSNQMLWISKMNSIKSIVEEIVLKEYVIPDLVAFYLANGYSRHCLSDYPLRNHINSAIDVFNWGCDISRLIPKVKEILKIKYNLIIIKDNPMILKKYC